MRLIGITGRARSGKDTAAAHLIEQYDLTRYSFADPLKDGIKVMLGLTEEHVNGHLKEKVIAELGVSPRRIMQTLGTEWGRNTIRSDLWVLLAEKRWKAMQEKGTGGMVLADVRFEDEAQFVERNGGLVIHVARPAVTKVEAHESESGIQFRSGHVGIVNNGSIEDLHRRLDTAVGMWDVVRTLRSDQTRVLGGA